MKFRPLHDRVVVRRIEEDDRTKGGIIIPDTAKGKAAAGPGCRRRPRGP
jgi:chaperonin GroES